MGVPSSPPWTVTLEVTAILPAPATALVGIVLYDSGSGKLISFELQADGSATAWEIYTWNSVTSPVTQLIDTPIAVYSENRWLRVHNDGTNLTFYVSQTGADWVELYQQPVTTFLPAISGAGVGFDLNTSGADSLIINVWTFEITTGAGTDTTW